MVRKSSIGRTADIARQRKKELADREKFGTDTAFIQKREKLASSSNISSKRAGKILNEARATEAERLFNEKEVAALATQLKAQQTAATRLAEEQRNAALNVPPQEQPQPQVTGLEQPQQLPQLPEGFAGTGQVTPVTPEDVFNVATLGVGTRITSTIKLGKGLVLPITESVATNAAAKKTITKSLKFIGKKLKDNSIKFGIGAGATVFGIGKVVGLPKKRLQNIDTAQSQIRESLTFPIQSVTVGRLDPNEALDELQNMEDIMTDYGRQLREMQIVKVTELDPQVIDAAIIRNRKIIGFLDNAQFIVQTAQVAGTAPDPEQVALLIESLKEFERRL